MQANTFTIDVDIKQNNYINEPVVKQNDAVIFIINLTDNGAPVDLTGVTTYTIATERADGVSIVSVGTKTGPSQVMFNMPRETTASVGRAKATVQLYDADKRVSSFTFPLVVEKDPSASLIVTGGDRTLIEIVLGEGPKVIADAKTATSAANTATGKANTAAMNADSKASAANTAAGAANTAAGKANTSASAADLAAGKVDGAIARTDASASAADAATLKANTAAGNADSKAILAQQAADKATAEATGLETLKSDVVAATGTANTAASAANTAADKANASSTVADASATKAGSATTAAELQTTYAKAQGDFAKDQGDYAKLQGDHAKAEGDKAALETTDLTGMKTAVTQATSDAITAAELANTESTGLATMKADVVAATANATGASTQATTQAQYAKTQGDYAKAQGDAVQGIFDAGLVASVNGQTGAVVITAADIDAVKTIPGKSLSTEDYTTAEKAKLTGIETGANKYIHPESHPASMIIESPTRRFGSDEKFAEWDVKETTTGAQQKVNTAKQELTDALHLENEARTLHEKKQIHEGEIHGMRVFEEGFQYFDGLEWVELKVGQSGGGGLIIEKFDTPGTFLWPVPEGVLGVYVSMTGGGGGGGGAGVYGYGGNGTSGGVTSFGTLASVSGGGGAVTVTGGISGGHGATPGSSGAKSNAGIGGTTITQKGFGGNGGATTATGGNSGSGGGGGGVLVDALIDVTSLHSANIVIGAGGSGGIGANGAANGSAGQDGILLIKYAK